MSGRSGGGGVARALLRLDDREHLGGAARADEAPVAAPLADVDVDDEGADSIDSEETLEDTRAEGDDAWSSARDWADNSAVPSVTDTSEGSDVTPHNLGGDLPVEGDTTA